MFTKKLRSIMNTKVDDYFIMTLILISLVTLPMETMKGITPSSLSFLKSLDNVIIIIFTIEYLIRVYLDKMEFAFSVNGIIDFIAIAPYYFSLFCGYQNADFLILFRMFRMLKLARYTNAFNVFSEALKIAKDELILFSFVTFGILYFAAVGIYHFEHKVNPEMYNGIFESLWWAVITLTTIGYGDIYPVTLGGRLLTILLALIGLGIVAIPTSILSSALTEVKRKEE